MAQLSVGQRASAEAVHACKLPDPGAFSAPSKLRIGQGLRTERVRSWRNSSHCVCSRCRNFSTHFDWRRLAVSSSVFSHDILHQESSAQAPLSLGGRLNLTTRVSSYPTKQLKISRCGAPRGANPNLLLRCYPSLNLSPLAQFPWVTIPPHLMRVSHWCSQ